MVFDKILKKIYIRRLINRGLKVGKNFQLEKGANIDAVFPALISIGDNVTIAKDAYILSHDGSTKKVLGFTRVGKVIIKDNVFIGAKAVIMPGVTIGKNAIIGTCSVINKSVPDNEVWAGVPAKKICSVEEFMIKHKTIMEKIAPLVLNGKKVHQIEKSVVTGFIDCLGDEGYIE